MKRVHKKPARIEDIFAPGDLLLYKDNSDDNEQTTDLWVEAVLGYEPCEDKRLVFATIVPTFIPRKFEVDQFACGYPLVIKEWSEAEAIRCKRVFDAYVKEHCGGDAGKVVLGSEREFNDRGEMKSKIQKIIQKRQKFWKEFVVQKSESVSDLEMAVPKKKRANRVRVLKSSAGPSRRPASESSKTVVKRKLMKKKKYIPTPYEMTPEEAQEQAYKKENKELKEQLANKDREVQLAIMHEKFKLRDQAMKNFKMAEALNRRLAQIAAGGPVDTGPVRPVKVAMDLTQTIIIQENDIDMEEYPSEDGEDEEESEGDERGVDDDTDGEEDEESEGDERGEDDEDLDGQLAQLEQRKRKDSENTGRRQRQRHAEIEEDAEEMKHIHHLNVVDDMPGGVKKADIKKDDEDEMVESSALRSPVRIGLDVLQNVRDWMKRKTKAFVEKGGGPKKEKNGDADEVTTEYKYAQRVEINEDGMEVTVID